jgi:cell division septation protein DedD
VARKKKSKSAVPRKTLLIWSGVAFFIAAWMFVLGILVGRGTAPVNLEVGKLEKELADLKAAMTRKEQAKINAQTSGKGNGKPQLGFYEALKDPKQTKPFKDKPSAKQVAKKPPKPARTEKRVQTKPIQAKKTPQKPSARQSKKPAAQSVASDPGNAHKGKGRYTIQVAAVKETGNAERLVAQLRSKGYPAYQVRVDVPGKGALHRIRVGAFDSRAAADRMLAKLKAGRHGGMVVSTK